MASPIEITEKSPSSCGCGAAHEALPELDVQTIPHAVRHGAIFGALAQVRPGAAMIIRATHNPLPLLGQLADREPGAFQIQYLDDGPEYWRIQFTRIA